MAATADLANRRASNHRSERSTRRRSGCRSYYRRPASARAAKWNAGFARAGCRSTARYRPWAPSLPPRDRITLDGRPVRLHTPAVKELRVLLVPPLAGRDARFEGRHLARGGTFELAARLGALARDSAHAAGRRRTGNSHRRRILGASRVARRARADHRLRAANARASQGGSGRGISRRHGLRRRGDEHSAGGCAVRRGVQSLAQRHGARRRAPPKCGIGGRRAASSSAG